MKCYKDEGEMVPVVIDYEYHGIVVKGVMAFKCSVCGDEVIDVEEYGKMRARVFEYGVNSAQFEIYKDHKGKHRWRLRSLGDNKIIADSVESYETLADCQHCIELVKKEAPSAQIQNF